MGFSRHIVLNVVVFIALTSVCQAQTSKPSLVSEQTFLYQVQNKQSHLIKNEGWTLLGKGKWELLIEDFKYNHIQEDVRFVSLQNLNKPSQFFLLVYKKNNAGEWIPRYGQKPDGTPQVVGTYDTGSDYISMYITPVNVKDKLDYAKIEYEDDVDPMKKLIYEDMMIALKDKDIHHRDLLRQISGFSMPIKETVTREKYPWMDEKLVDQDGLIKQISTNILYGAAYGLAALKISYPGKYHEDLKNMFAAKNTGFTETALGNSTYKRITDEVVKDTDFIKSRPYINIEKEVVEFNKHVKAIKSICQTIKKQNDSDIHQAVEQTPTYFVSPGNEYNIDSKIQKDGEKFATIEQKYQALADQGAKEHLDYISSETPLALFWSSKIFTEAAKKFSPQGCVKDGNLHLNLITIDNVVSGISEVRNNFITSINKQVEIIQSKRNTYGGKTLKTMIRSSPLAVHTAILQRNVVSEILFTAQNVKEIYQKDQFNVYVDHALMATGFSAGLVAGAFSGGTLGAAIFYVMLTVDAVSLARGGTQWYDAYFLDQKIRQSMASGQIRQSEGMAALEQNQADLKAGKTVALMTVGGNAVGYGVGAGIKAATRNKTIVNVVSNADESVGAGSRATTAIGDAASVTTKVQNANRVYSAENKLVTQTMDRSNFDVKIAAGKNQPISERAHLSEEFTQAAQKIQEKFGPGYRVLHVQETNALVINPKGKLEEVFIYKDGVELEGMVNAITFENVTWKIEDGNIVKEFNVADGTTIRIFDDPKKIIIIDSNGRKIATKLDPTLESDISNFLISADDQVAQISEGFVLRNSDRILLIQFDRTVLNGKRSGSEVIFSNSDKEVIVNASKNKILDIDHARWGKPYEWKVLTMEGVSHDVSRFNVPKLMDDEGIPSGYGDINCSGLAFSGDVVLAGSSSKSCALPDFHYSDLVVKDATLSDVVGKSPTITPQNAAIHYGSKMETFDDYVSAHERLMKMEDGGTALIYTKNPQQMAHVANARKEGNQVVYYDFQDRTISIDPEVQFFYNNTSKIDIVETSQYHQFQDLTNPLPKINSSNSTNVGGTNETPALGKMVRRKSQNPGTTQPELFSDMEHLAITPDTQPDIIFNYTTKPIDFGELNSPTIQRLNSIYQDPKNFGEYPNQLKLIGWDSFPPGPRQNELFLELIQNELHFKTLGRRMVEIEDLKKYYEASHHYYIAWKNNHVEYGRLFQNARAEVFVMNKDGEIFSLNSFTKEQFETAILLPYKEVKIIAGSYPALEIPRDVLPN
jgi:hypothetical protein